MKEIAHFEAYVDFISTVLLCAPDRFPARDWLHPSKQMNLERAFQALDDYFFLVTDRVSDETLVSQMRSELKAARLAYQAGDEMKGAKLIQAFERAVVANGRR